MQLHDAIFTTKRGALTAVVRASRSLSVPSATILSKGKAKPLYRRGQLVGYKALYPTQNGSICVVRETHDGQIYLN